MQTGAHGLPSPLAHWRSCSVYGIGDGDQTSDTCLSPPSVLAVLAFGSTPLQIYPLLDNLSANLLMPYISERAPYILSIGPFNILVPKEGSESLCSLPITPSRTFPGALKIHSLSTALQSDSSLPSAHRFGNHNSHSEHLFSRYLTTARGIVFSFDRVLN